MHELNVEGFFTDGNDSVSPKRVPSVSQRRSMFLSQTSPQQSYEGPSTIYSPPLRDTMNRRIPRSLKVSDCISDQYMSSPSKKIFVYHSIIFW